MSHIAMASGNNVETGRLGREFRRIEINTNISRSEEFTLTELTTRRLRTRAISVSISVVPPRASSD